MIEKLEGLLEAALQKAKESGGEPSSLETLPERNESTEDPEKEDLKRRLAALESSRQRDREVSPRPEAMSTKGQKSRKDSIGESGLDDFRRELENERRRYLWFAL